MNCEVFTLPELEVELHQIKEVLRAILHTIMFNRALGLVRPRDTDSELFNITYVQCGDPAIERAVEEKIDAFVAWVERQAPAAARGRKCGQMNLAFFEKRQKQLWFSHKEERLFWEQWYIPLSVVTCDSSDLNAARVCPLLEHSRRHRTLEPALRNTLTQILKIVNEKKDHIPPVVSSDVASFPYQISIPSASDSSFGMDMLKRMLQTSPPAMLSQ
eukprot:jgi/Mesvir1/26104/Mv06823-RA.1